jgi:hypothetical protein
MSDDPREITVPQNTKAAAEAGGEQTLNWADFIDSLHEFRAPTFRLARAYWAAPGTEPVDAADEPTSGDSSPG